MQHIDRLSQVEDISRGPSDKDEQSNDSDYIDGRHRSDSSVEEIPEDTRRLPECHAHVRHA
jgi:hypothetical protein